MEGLLSTGPTPSSLFSNKGVCRTPTATLGLFLTKPEAKTKLVGSKKILVCVQNFGAKVNLHNLPKPFFSIGNISYDQVPSSLS